MESCYSLLVDSLVRMNGLDWKRLWGTKIHERLKVFIRYLFSGVLLLTSMLNKRMHSSCSTCLLCGMPYH